MLNGLNPQYPATDRWTDALRKTLQSLQSHEEHEDSVWCDICLQSYLPAKMPPWKELPAESKEHAIHFHIFDTIRSLDG